MSVHIARDNHRTLCGRHRRQVKQVRTLDEFRRGTITANHFDIAWCLTCTDTFWAREMRRPDK